MDTGKYYELQIASADQSLREMLIAHLAAIGYDGFEETDAFLKAYIPESGFEEIELNKLLKLYDVTYSLSIINKENWNLLWEANFEPVQVDDFVGIRAAFHPHFTHVSHEIIITPKMSFGTGHHATTWLVMQLMRDLDFAHRSVFDFGTGTGILAILAEKLGATRILAVDNDNWCIENASENILVNQCKYIDIQDNNTVSSAEQFDVVIANINRNIILDNIALIATALLTGGDLLLSGLLVDDEKDILAACEAVGLMHRKTAVKNGWIAMQFCKN